MLNHVFDKYLLFGQGSIFGQASLTDNLKSKLIPIARDKSGEVKDKFINEINAFPCSGRRLDFMEIEQDGSQRLLEEPSTFGALSTKILEIDGVQDAVGGFFPDRKELGMDFALHVEEVFGASDFEAALSSVFGELGDAQALFDLNNAPANVAGLLSSTDVIATFDLRLNIGMKISELKQFFSTGTSASSQGDLFLRVDELSFSARAAASGLSIDLFPGSSTNVDILDGSLSLSAGLRLPSPFELEIAAGGSLVNGIGLSDTFMGQISFVPVGKLSASLPFTATLYEVSQTLTVLFEDGDLFDNEPVLVTVDFNACQVKDLLQSLLGKLGSTQFSFESIVDSKLGPQIEDFFEKNKDKALSSLNKMFPNVGQFVEGALEGETFARVEDFASVFLYGRISSISHFIIYDTAAKNEVRYSHNWCFC